MIPKTIEELNRIRQDCLSMVNRKAANSAAVAIIPMPGVDITADIVILLQLLTQINRKFGLSPEHIKQFDSETKAKILFVVSSIGCKLAGKVITKELILKVLKRIGVKVTVEQAVKLVPLLGQAVSAGISYGTIKFLGHSHIEECYSVCKRVIDMNQT